MNRPVRVTIIVSAMLAVAALISACGTERIPHRSSRRTVYAGAVIFSQRCAGCHTLSYAATHGSGANIRSRLITNGPNFNVRCERPITACCTRSRTVGSPERYMPQNIVVGPEARAVARFVATYAGRQAVHAGDGAVSGTADRTFLPPPAPTGVSAPRAASGGVGGRDRGHDEDGRTAGRRRQARQGRQGQEGSQGRVASQPQHDPRRGPVLDIRLIRRDPDAVRTALAAAGARSPRRSTVCSSSTTAGAR